MKKIILIVNDDRVRQLYHKILLLKGIEVVPVSNLSIATMFLNLDDFDLAILAIDHNQIEAEIFLKIRQKSKNLLKTKLIILSENQNFDLKVNKSDILIPAFKTPTDTIVKLIEKSM